MKMAFAFKIWDQSNDGNTMAIRVSNTEELDRLATVCTGEDAAGVWSSLRNYLDAGATAQQRPEPYHRNVDILWLEPSPALPFPYCQSRGFEVTYTGEMHTGGGFSSQGYCIVAPAWNAALRPHEKQEISAEWYRGADRDLVVVRG
jgi:hypothetical protein